MPTKSPEVIESRRWRHRLTGATASIYGAHPDYKDPNWEVVTTGWTIRWSNGTVGCGRPPFATREEAQAAVDRYLERIAS